MPFMRMNCEETDVVGDLSLHKEFDCMSSVMYDSTPNRKAWLTVEAINTTLCSLKTEEYLAFSIKIVP